MYFLQTSYTLIMFLKVLSHFIMKIKNFMKYFKEGSWSISKISWNFKIFQSEIFHRASLSTATLTFSLLTAGSSASRNCYCWQLSVMLTVQSHMSITACHAGFALIKSRCSQCCMLIVSDYCRRINFDHSWDQHGWITRSLGSADSRHGTAFIHSVCLHCYRVIWYGSHSRVSFSTYSF